MRFPVRFGKRSPVRMNAAKYRKQSGQSRNLVAPAIVGTAFLLSSPTMIAYQDMASMISGADGGNRWASFLERSPVGSIHKASMAMVDEQTTGSITGGGIDAPGIGTISIAGKAGPADLLPDEERVNRSDKQGRVVAVAPKAPPKAFNAGSILQRHSSLLRPVQTTGVKMAFAKPKAEKDGLQIAQAFYRHKPRKADPQVPPMLASLVTNEKADILATAYAPAKPDYSRTSPFASILKDDDEEGRFIPPAQMSDHNWARSALPPLVFSQKEQKCLATGIYFEARGESVKGQAAVAQVILNRVRNPAYPATICGVVFQNEDWLNRCQFSFACDGRKLRITEQKHWKIAQDVAIAVTAGKIWLPEVGSSTHYHATYVNPRWARTMEKMKKIGTHIFYRTYGGGWS